MRERTFKKGEMLVESVVAMTVAAIVLCCIFATLKGFFSISKNEKEFVKAEAICLDINDYYDAIGGDIQWARAYFGSAPADHKIYYDAYFKQTVDPNKRIYELNYDYDENGYLVVNFKNIKDNKEIIKDLNYGESEATNFNEYRQQVETNNINIEDPKDILAKECYDQYRYVDGEECGECIYGEDEFGSCFLEDPSYIDEEGEDDTGTGQQEENTDKDPETDKEEVAEDNKEPEIEEGGD